MSTPTIKDIRARSAARRARLRGRRRGVMVVTGVAVLVGVVLWLILPGVVREQLETRGGAWLERDVTVARVAFNPLTLAMTVEGMQVLDPDGREVLAWERLRVDAKFWATVTGSWGLDGLEVDGLRVRLERDAAGRLNIDDVLAGLKSGGSDEAEAGEDAVGMRPVVLDRLEVRDAQIALADHSRSHPFATTVGPLTFGVTGFHTRFDPEAPYEFVARTESGESLRWRGALSLVPLHSVGEFEIEGVVVPKYAAYYADWVPVDIRQGTVALRGRYAVAWSEERRELRLPAGELVVTDLEVAERGNPDNRQRLARLALRGISADVVGREYDVARVELAEGDLGWDRTAAGFAWLGVGLGAAEGVAPSSTGSEETEEPWARRARIDAVVVDDVGLRWRDATWSEPVEQDVHVRALTWGPLALTDLAEPAAVDLQVEFPAGGELTVAGAVAISPWQPDLEVVATELALPIGSDYLREATGLTLDAGTVSTRGRLGMGEGGMEWRGSVVVAGAEVGGADGQPVATVERGELDQAEVRFDPMAVEVGAVRLAAPTVALHRDTAGRLNLSAGEREGEAGGDTVAAGMGPEGRGDAGPQLEVGEITLEGARVVWRDDAAWRPVAVSLDGLSGRMAGWSSRDAARAQVSLAGEINGVAPVSLVGDLNPLGRPAHADLQVKVDGVDLAPLAGYFEQYAGFALAGGDLSLDIDFGLRERNIRSETVTVLDQFALGDVVESPDATTLPLKLAVALLQDPAGEIVVDIPVAGDLDDPEFRMGRVIWRVIGNLLTKAATSPFALLGSVVGSEAEVDLEHHGFAPGETGLGEAAMTSLGLVSKALAARPGLAVEVRGEFAPEEDGLAWRAQHLEQRLRERAAPGDWSETTGWRELARDAALMAEFEYVFGVPPIDFDAPLPGVAAGEEAEAQSVEPGEVSEVRPAAEVDDTLFGWLRRVLAGPPAAAEDATAEQETDDGLMPDGAGVIPLPENLPPVFAALPVAEVEARLREAIDVGDAELRALAQARAEAVRAYLSAAGLADERITVVDPAEGAARVTLMLR